jgi:hypothetical protein
VLLVIAALLLLSYALLTRGFSVPVQCVFGQATHLRNTLRVELADEHAAELERALAEIAERRSMTFGTSANSSSASGRPGVMFEVCSREAHLAASRDNDREDTFVIYISQAASASDEQAKLVAADVGAWIEGRRGP